MTASVQLALGDRKVNVLLVDPVAEMRSSGHGQNHLCPAFLLATVALETAHLLGTGANQRGLVKNAAPCQGGCVHCSCEYGIGGKAACPVKAQRRRPHLRCRLGQSTGIKLKHLD